MTEGITRRLRAAGVLAGPTDRRVMFDALVAIAELREALLAARAYIGGHSVGADLDRIIARYTDHEKRHPMEDAGIASLHKGSFGGPL